MDRMHFLVAGALLAVAAQAKEVSPKLPLVGGNGEFEANEEYATKAGMAAVPGLVVVVLTLLIYTCCLIKGILVCLYRCCCCCCKMKVDDETMAARAAKFKEPSRLCKVITHFVCGALVVAGVATAFTANAEARGGVDNTFSTLNEFADHLSTNLVKVEDTFEAVFANISKVSNDTSSTNMTDQIGQFSQISTSIDDLSDNVNDNRGQVDEYNGFREIAMYAIFAFALVVMLGAILGALCRSACTTRIFCGLAFLPLLVFGLVLATHLVFAGVIADICPGMEKTAIDAVGEGLEPDVSYMLTCEPTLDGKPFPLANTTLGEAMSIGDNMKDVLEGVRDDAQEKYDQIPPSKQNSSEAQELKEKIRIANATLLGVDRLDDHIETLLDCKFFRKAFRGLQDVLCEETYNTMVLISFACIMAVVGLAISAVTMNFTITAIKKSVKARKAAEELELS